MRISEKWSPVLAGKCYCRAQTEEGGKYRGNKGMERQRTRISVNFDCMKVSDWIVRTLVFATFFALLVLPDKYSAPMGLFCLIVVGAWSIFYPQGVLGWAKAAHPSIDVEDSSLWWLPRLIGGCFLIVGLFLILAMHRSIAR
jgi:hypothetical protein